MTAVAANEPHLGCTHATPPESCESLESGGLSQLAQLLMSRGLTHQGGEPTDQASHRL